MEWIKTFIETSSWGIEPVCGLLYQLGITGLVIENPKDLEDFLNCEDRLWDYIDNGLLEHNHTKKTGITFFLRNNPDGIKTLGLVKDELNNLLKLGDPLGTLKVTIKNMEDENWANNWKKYFKPFKVGKKMLIKPSWEAPPAETDRIILEIDPENVFGSGIHETTNLSIQALEDYVTADSNVLDIGCGSGILAIASLLLGAKHADAFDIDPAAKGVAYENAKKNNIGEDALFAFTGDIINDGNIFDMLKRRPYNIITANIIADIIISLTDIIPDIISREGIFIASGIISERLKDVSCALEEKGFLIRKISKRGEWVMIASQYKGVCLK